MGIVKSLVGGLVGGALGAVLANLIQSAAGISSPWFLLVTGLGTGLGVRAAAGANRSFATGVVGAITAVIALLGSSVATSFAEVSATPDEVVVTEIEAADDPDAALESETAAEDAGEEPGDDSAAEPDEDATASDSESSDEAEDSESDDAAETAEESEPEPIDEAAARAATAAASAATAPFAGDGPITDEAALEQLERQQGWSVMDFLFNGVSALLAFALASGSGSNAPKSEKS